MSIDFEIFFDSFWQSPSLVQTTANNFTKASQKLHESMLPARSPWWEILWEWTSIMDVFGFQYISWRFPWTSFGFVHAFLLVSLILHWKTRWFGDDCQFCLASCGDRRFTKQNPECFQAKLITQWACNGKSRRSISMSDFFHTPY